MVVSCTDALDIGSSSLKSSGRSDFARIFQKVQRGTSVFDQERSQDYGGVLVGYIPQDPAWQCPPQELGDSFLAKT